MNAARFVPCLLAAALFLAAGDSPVITVPPFDAGEASVPCMAVTVDDLPVTPPRRHDDAQRAALTERRGYRWTPLADALVSELAERARASSG